MKKIYIAALIIALTSLLVAGATMAWFTDEDNAGMATFTSGTLSIEAGASMIFGVEEITGDLYEIDLTNGNSYLLYDRTIGTTNDKYVNALAYDRVNKRLYYTPHGTSLYFYDFNAETLAGTLSGGRPAGATFGGGYYWYIPQATNDLRRVDFNPDGSIKTDVVFWADFAGGNFSFGDIALDISNNVLYGSANASTKVFFKIDLTSKIYTQIDQGYPNHMQISFGSDGALYGHVNIASGNPNLGWYKINISNGDTEALSWSPGGRNYNDLASNVQNKWNPSDVELIHYYVKNTGSKSMNFRLFLNAGWVASLSSSNIMIGLDDAMDSGDWVIVGHTMYYLPTVAPGETVQVRLNIELDGLTDDSYQGQSFKISPIFDAIQATNYAPYHEWGVSYYGAP